MRLLCFEGRRLFSTLKDLSQMKRCQPFITISLLQWQMYRRVTFLIPASLARSRHAMFMVEKHPDSLRAPLMKKFNFYSGSFFFKTVTLRNKHLRENAFMTATILLSLRSRSIDIYPSFTHNSLISPFLQQSHSVIFYLELPLDLTLGEITVKK